MPQLTTPSAEYQASFLEAVVEYRAEGRYLELDPRSLSGPSRFRDYVRGLLRQATGAELIDGRVAATVLWWVEGPVYLGRVSIRHRLTDSLRRRGGNIGYDVRPSFRRRGHGRSMLAAALPIASSLNIDPALVTCDARNLASRRIIEAAGGVFQDELAGELRFWVPTASPATRR